MRKSRKGIIEENPTYIKFVVVDDPTGLFNPGAWFPATQILGVVSKNKPVTDYELPEGIIMLYKRYGEVQYRCKFTDGELRVIGRN